MEWVKLFAVSAVLIVTTVLVHYGSLRAVTHGMARESRGRQGGGNLRKLMVLVIGIMFLVHLAEMFMYAVALYFIDGRPGFGDLTGLQSGQFAEYMYFSLVTYTALGYGDIVATGKLRLLTGFEALNGLLLIAWTGSFTFLLMQRIWSYELSPDDSGPDEDGSATTS